MKKTILTLALLGSIITASAQTKQPEAKPVKPQFKKVVVIPIEDYQSLTGGINELKNASMYNPNLTADQKEQQFKGIDSYLKELPSRVRLDSVKVEGKK